MTRPLGKGAIRAFIAVNLPASVKEALGELQKSMSQAGLKARWTQHMGIHVTLKFLGAVSDDRVPAIRAAMEEAAGGFRLMEARVAGVGAFPNERWPRVVWVGLDEPTGDLATLHARLEAALEPLGFEPEGRPFRPHLTLARIKVPARAGKVAQALEEHRGVDLGKITVDRIVLYQSTLKPSGALYTALEEVFLEEA
jgi:2'-5' RNA ligase